MAKVFGELTQLKESVYDAASGKLTMTIIKPGFNLSKERYYPSAVLKRDHKIFEGAKMFADHQTERQQREQPEGSVHSWVASVKRVWPESDGTLKGEAIVIDPSFKSKLSELNKQGMLGDMGISIRAVGEASKGKIDGTETTCIESLLRARSVDFVTYAGAGGRVEMLESNRNNGIDLDQRNELREHGKRTRAKLEEAFKRPGMFGGMSDAEAKLAAKGRDI